MQEVFVQKMNGVQEAFREEKVRESLRRAGIPSKLEEKAISYLKTKLYDGIQTWEIFQLLCEYLATCPNPYFRARYSLKQSIMMLGPTGYPFEDFVARMMEVDGYSTTVRQVLSGKCVMHEIDVVAKKDGRSLMIEAKFHNDPGNRSDVHVALYTKARFDDLKVKNNLQEGWLVTNTKATTDAIAYLECEGLTVVSWSYPAGKSLRDIVEKYTLHPVTILTSITIAQKAQLLQHHVVLCKDICADHTLLDKISLSPEEKKDVLKEIKFICEEEKDTAL